MAVVVTQLTVDASGAKLGVAEFTAAMDKAKRAAVEGGEATATSFERAQTKWTASLAKTDPVIKAQIAMERDLARQREIGANAVKLGIATQDAAGAQLDKVRQQHQAYISTLGNVGTATQKMAANTGLARYELINLSRQFQDVGVSLFSGQNPLTVAVQQGSQIADVFASSEGTVKGFFGQVAAGAASLITPTTVAITAVVALTAAAAALANQWDKVQVSSQRAISGAGERTGTTVSDLNQFTAQNSGGISGTGLSNKEARALGEDFTKTGEIVISRLHGMSDAVVGFSNQTGQSMSEASKAMVGFAVDPKKGLDELSKTYGSFDIATRKAVDALVLADDKTGAFQVVVDALAEKSKKAADNMGFLEKAARGVGNALATETTKPSGLESQLENARNKLNTAISSAPDMLNTAEASQNVERLSREFENLFAAIEKTKAATAGLDALSTKADAAVRAVTPEIDALEQLRAKLAELDRAKEAGATSKYGAAVDNAAALNIVLLINKTQEAQEAAARYDQRVANISLHWGNVGQSTAQALQAMQNALPVAEAWTNSGRMLAQYQATYNDLIDRGKTAQEATAIASKQEELSKAAAVASAQKLVQSSEDNLDKIRAQGTGMEGVVASSIAYRDAIQSGATAMQANIIAANTLTASILQAAQAQNQLDQSTASYNAQQVAAHQGSGTGDFVPITMTPGTHTFQTSGAGGTVGYTFAGTPITPPGYVEALLASQNPQVSADKFIQDALAQNNTSALGGGGIDGAIAAIQRVASLGTSVSGPKITDATSALQTLYGAKNAITPDNASKIANDQQFLGWLQSQPQTIANLQAISSLTSEIQSLANATNSNTSATNANSDLLSPYYATDPRTSHIGFRSQGMAMGGFPVPGVPSANDNMMATFPVASGENILYVDPQFAKRGMSGGGGTTQNITINMPMTFNGPANKDEVGRTAYQNAQNAARQIAAATR